MTLSYSTICERLRAHAKYTPEADFGEGHLEYPPASELSVQACEVKLGFKLPPMLREIYKTVANGGNFWPGYDFATTDDLIEQHNSFLRYRVSSRNQSRLFDDATVEAFAPIPAHMRVPNIYRMAFYDLCLPAAMSGPTWKALRGAFISMMRFPRMQQATVFAQIPLRNGWNAACRFHRPGATRADTSRITH